MATLPVGANDRDRKEVLSTRMFGFQYPLDSDSNYTTGWIGNFSAEVVEQDFQAIRSNFPQVNLLRIPIGWEDMNNTLLLTQMETVISLGKTYGFKFLFVLMDRVSGWWDTGPNPRNLLSSEYEDHEFRIRSVVSRYKTENQIYAWALSNELNVFQEVVYEWYEHFIPFLKNIDFDTPVCTSFYPLGLNASTISRAASLVALGLDFIEFHYYPNIDSNIDSDIDHLTAYVNRPIFLSEFSVADGLNHFTTEQNIAIINATVQTFQKRPNVIGLAYYRWSNDADNFTIWNNATQAPKPEAAALTVSGNFLQACPYSYLEHSETNSTEIYEIQDSSFAKTIEWPDTLGWSDWSNHTAYSLMCVPSNDSGMHTMTKREVTNYDFEQGHESDWDRDGPDQIADETSVVYSMNKSIRMWASGSDQVQCQHTAISIEPYHAYLLEGYVNITAQTGNAAAFIQLAFRDAYGGWLEWNQSEYYTSITNWTLIHAAGIAPLGAVDVMINCRVSGFGRSITAYFDYLTLYEVQPGSYDGKSFMIAFGECTEPTWNAVQVSQNFTFLNPTEDIHKLWTFSATVATVFSSEYDTDWKGAFVELAFTTDNSSEWITWYIGEYLSGNNNWKDVSVAGFPPSNANGLQMIVKVVNCHYGVLLVDNASLTSTAAVIPEEWIMPEISKDQEYQVSLKISTMNNTFYNGTFVSPGSWTILDSNCTWFKGNTFGSIINDTSETISFTFGSGPIEIWMPIMFTLGIIGIVFLLIFPVITIRKLKQGHREWLIYCFIFVVLAVILISVALWSLWR